MVGMVLVGNKRGSGSIPVSHGSVCGIHGQRVLSIISCGECVLGIISRNYAKI